MLLNIIIIDTSMHIKIWSDCYQVGMAPLRVVQSCAIKIER